MKYLRNKASGKIHVAEAAGGRFGYTLCGVFALTLDEDKWVLANSGDAANCGNCKNILNPRKRSASYG